MKLRAPWSAWPLVLLLGLQLLFPLACAPRPLPVARGAEPEFAAAEKKDPPAAIPLAALTAEEQKISVQLRAFTTELMALGERNVAHEWELAAATDYIASTLEAASFEVVRHGFMDRGRLAQSLEVAIAGKHPEAPVFVVGARFDAPLGSPGADDNASGAAALALLAKHLGAEPRLRALRFVFFSDASNRVEPEASGAPSYLASLEREGVRVAAMLELSGLGVYKLTAGSQTYPEYVPAQRETVGDFIAWGGYAGLSPEPVTQFFKQLQAQVSLPVRSFVLLPDEAVVAGSVHRAFAERDIPSFILFDTHRFRDPDFGGLQDTLERLDFDRMARVVLGLSSALDTLTTSPSAPPAASAQPPSAPPAASAQPPGPEAEGAASPSEPTSNAASDQPR